MMKFNWKALVEVIAGTILPIFVPVAAPVIPVIIHAIHVAEDMGGTGQEKLAKSVAITNDGIDTYNQLVVGTARPSIDKAAVNASIAGGVSAVVNAVNAVKKTPQ
jgi:hypothetical protein